MRLPLLPTEVNIRPANGPEFVCRPVSALGRVEAIAGKLPAVGYAETAVANLIRIPELMMGEDPGVPFDRENDAHLAALDHVWLMEVGMKLTERAHLKDEDAGK